MVIRNCLLVRDAAEAWAAESGGAYPADPESRNTSGHTLVDFLPGGTYLVNPFDGQRDEPKYLCHGHPGETDYLYYDGYGCGECGLDDCGHDGYIVDLLPCGILLPNSYLCVRIEPRDGQAVNPGEIGYVVTMQDAHCTGYWITGYGRRGIVIVLGKNPSDHEAPMNYKLRPHAL